MGMDILRCKTPAMIRKEILMTFIAYNGIRHLMNQAARQQHLTLRRVSFKGSIQALRTGKLTSIKPKQVLRNRLDYGAYCLNQSPTTQHLIDPVDESPE
jgi:hypothetical protein